MRNRRKGFLEEYMDDDVPVISGEPETQQLIDYIIPVMSNETEDATFLSITALNVRSGPGIGYPKLNVFAKGTLVRISEEQKDEKGDRWGKITGSDSWVSLTYCDRQTTPP